jgi:hypothetical protein
MHFFCPAAPTLSGKILEISIKSADLGARTTLSLASLWLCLNHVNFSLEVHASAAQIFQQASTIEHSSCALIIIFVEIL